MRLLYTKRSPFARKVRVLALEKAINLDLIDEDLAKKSPLLLASNPLGKVPTLILDNGEIIFDSVVICQYLDELNNKIVLIPKSGKARWEVLKWEATADDMVVAAINIYMEKIRHPNDFHEKSITVQEDNIKKAYDYAASHLGELKELTLAPIAFAAALGYINFRLPHLKPEGAVGQWFNQFSKRPSMAQTIPVA